MNLVRRGRGERGGEGGEVRRGGEGGGGEVRRGGEGGGRGRGEVGRGGEVRRGKGDVKKYRTIMTPFK